VSASIESVERGRAAVERVLAASEERVKLLEKRLADEQERRVALLEDQMEALRLENAALKADSLLQRRDPNFAANEGVAEAAELDQWLGSLNLARYTPALVHEGYDALEFLLAASAEEISSLCVSAKLKAPHAQKLRRELARLKDAAGSAAASK
jgi:ABC-type phosphate transport system auxiliary subunit